MTAPASPPVAGVDRIGVYEAICDWIRNDVGLGVQMGLTPDATKKLVARIEALASPVSGDGSLQAEDRPSVPTCDGATVALDASQRKAIERAALDAGCHVWRHCRLAMVDGDEIVGYPAFSRADMAELARLYREDQAPPAASRSPDMETLQASECTKHGEGDQ